VGCIKETEDIEKQIGGISCPFILIGTILGLQISDNSNGDISGAAYGALIGLGVGILFALFLIKFFKINIKDKSNTHEGDHLLTKEQPPSRWSFRQGMQSLIFCCVKPTNPAAEADGVLSTHPTNSML